jgi:RNA polymerase sigma factor (sigma-70 family)
MLVRAAAAGDHHAWEHLVDAYATLICAIARNHHLTAADAAEVSQTAWLRLVEHIDRLDEPARVGAWLATTTRRECLRIIERRARNVSVGDPSLYTEAAPFPPARGRRGDAGAGT